MARKIKIDFTGVESFVKCEEGQHVAKLIEIAEKQAASSGADMLEAKFEVIKGNSAGAILYENFVLTQKALFKLKGFLEIVGKKADNKVMIDLDNLIGSTCIIDVVHEEYNGNMKSKINAYKKLTATTPEAEESDDEETEDDFEEEAPPAPVAKPAAKPVTKPAAPVAKPAAKPVTKAVAKPAPVEEVEEETEDDDDWEDS